MGKIEIPEIPRAGRWSFWLFAGVVAGLLIGFTVGLTKPRPRLV